MKLRHWLLVFGAASFMNGCATYRTAKEVRLIGFDENVAKGTSVGEIEGDDCIFIILGYRLGGMPSISKALSNARKQRTSTMGDTFGGSGSSGDSLRYINNVSVQPGGFNYGFFGKDCYEVRGMGYK